MEVLEVGCLCAELAFCRADRLQVDAHDLLQQPPWHNRLRDSVLVPATVRVRDRVGLHVLHPCDDVLRRAKVRLAHEQETQVRLRDALRNPASLSSEYHSNLFGDPCLCVLQCAVITLCTH